MVANIKRFLTILTVVFIAAVLSACGFQLRGSVNMPAAMQHTYVSGISEYSDFGREIRRALLGTGISVQNVPDNATAELVILENSTNKRVLSVQASGQSTGKVEEYELQQRLVFKVKTSDGKTLLEPQKLEVTRGYLYDRNDPLGKSGEEDAIREEMRRDLIQLMMLRLQAIHQP